MSSADPQFTSLSDKEKFIYLMQSNEQETLAGLQNIYTNHFIHEMN